jgi:hypothetical protein
MLNRAIQQRYGWVWPLAAVALAAALVQHWSGMTACLIGILAGISLSGSV